MPSVNQVQTALSMSVFPSPVVPDLTTCERFLQRFIHTMSVQ